GGPRGTERGGARADPGPKGDRFGNGLKGPGSPVSSPMVAPARAVTPILEEFTRDGTFAGSIVVGSPYTHGPFNTTARDSPYAVELGFFLGRLFAAPKGLVVRLDT